MKRWILTFYLSLSFLLSAKASSLPDLGTPIAKISANEEKKLGQIFINSIRAQTVAFDDPITNEYFKALGHKLAKKTGNTSVNWHFFLINDANINAFAGPDGHVGLFTGLFRITNNESELAGVLAHEVEHINQRHIIRGMQEGEQSSLNTIGLILAAIALSSHTNGMATAGAITAASAGNIQHMINYTRRFEKEADRLGIKLLSETGYDPNGMLTFFNRLQQMTSSYGEELPEILRSHPLTESRLADLANRIKALPKHNGESSSEWKLTKARVIVLTDPSPSHAIEYFSEHLKKNNTPENLYGYAYSLARGKENKVGEKILMQLAEQNPKQVIYPVTLAELKLDHQKFKAAEAILARVHVNYPHYYPATLMLADVYLSMGKPNKALPILNNQNKNRQNDPVTLFMLAQAQGRLGQLLPAYQSQAKAFELWGGIGQSIILLKQALHLPDLSQEEKKTIEQHINLMKKQLED